MERTILTMAEVAELLCTPVDTLRYWRHRGSGPEGFKVGRRVMYDRSEVERWLEEKRREGAGARAS